MYVILQSVQRETVMQKSHPSWFCLHTQQCSFFLSIVKCMVFLSFDLQVKSKLKVNGKNNLAHYNQVHHSSLNIRFIVEVVHDVFTAWTQHE